ncbi:metalloregulator ArsR/SmtB family transcription factor [Bacillus cereus]|uniref:ArsR/SmtB family transcription factor n=1 Tax=Bacillus TaxID=1386 RepID=UPI0003637F13|nr:MULTISPECIES: metalloregulator ArsR/SmtB family transcription factor [Bacillus cereus group]MCH5449301.1 metalloregulator ArsR/SmtB family transcription factor [Bacillus cereus]MCU5025073.1 metalloregulator ArsR/SmtB family transcription factor [Bacillus cereus]MCU5186727.1 metalloregulator ArsR/SmtB family transcription factor [Bacillus cereus]MCU5643351.1 metalloregulator ArsR/SmtB family transcription factor [Bacillus cereus]MDA2644539.1 metalloregulator ArsR/SmtB family transcription fa
MNVYYTYRQQAEILKKIGHPVRLCILQQLIKRGNCSVTELCDLLEVPQSTISQHLWILKELHIVDCKNEGRMKIYKICHEGVIKIVTLLVKV